MDNICAYSWLVWSVLTAQDYTHIRGTAEAQFLVGLANQMARCGKWQWSIFALLHLKDSILCRNAVEDILAHNCSPEEELVESEVFVMEKLKVPKEWVYHAKAQRAGYEHWHDLRAAHLLLSCQWNEAHLEIVNHLAVDAIITGVCVFSSQRGIGEGICYVLAVALAVADQMPVYVYEGLIGRMIC